MNIKYFRKINSRNVISHCHAHTFQKVMHRLLKLPSIINLSKVVAIVLWGGGASCASVTHDSCLRHRPCSFHLLRPRRRVSMTSCPSREENMTGRDFYIMSTHGKYWQGGERKAESRSWCLKSTDGSTNAYLLLQSAKQTKKSSTIFKGSIMTGPLGLFHGLNMKIIWWAVLQNLTWWQNALKCCFIYTIIITWCNLNYLLDSTCILNHDS